MVGGSPDLTQITSCSTAEGDDRKGKSDPVEHKFTQLKEKTGIQHHTSVGPPARGRESQGSSKQNKSKVSGLSEIRLDDPLYRSGKNYSKGVEKAVKTTRQETKKITAEKSAKQGEDGHGQSQNKGGSTKRAEPSATNVKPKDGGRSQKTKPQQRKARPLENTKEKVKSEGVKCADLSRKLSSGGKKQSSNRPHKQTEGDCHGLGSTAQKSSGQNSTKMGRSESESKSVHKPQKSTGKKADVEQETGGASTSVTPSNQASELEDFHEVAEDLQEKLQAFFKDMYLPKNSTEQLSEELQTTLNEICSHTTDVVAAANQILHSIPGDATDTANLETLSWQVENARMEAESAEERFVHLLEKNTPHKEGAK